MARNVGWTATFGYYGADNTTTFKCSTLTFNSDNQESISNDVFDGNGNPTTYKSSTFTFDTENRVTAMGSSWSAAYGADGRRASKTVSGTTTYYLYDHGEPVVELNSSSSVTAVSRSESERSDR